eukprot:GHVL01019856.1.p1 GENE.GHVL01019856.1~~GHVL01019856.1.p1  ORF type:complete len:480 (-),score=104.60 GHVL01019856.1:279-1718(-)
MVSVAKKIVFVVFGSCGDVLPIVSVARKLAVEQFHVHIAIPQKVFHEVMSIGNDSESDPHFQLTLMQTNWLPDVLDFQNMKEDVLNDNLIDQLHMLVSSASLVLFNWCAISVWHIAQKLCIPTIVLSSSPQLRQCPDGFINEFQSNYSDYYLLLQENNNLCATQDVLSWMWRLFLDDHGRFREKINLPPQPFDIIKSGNNVTVIPLRTPVLALLSPTLYKTPDHMLAVETVCGWCKKSKEYTKFDKSENWDHIQTLLDGFGFIYVSLGSMFLLTDFAIPSHQTLIDIFYNVSKLLCIKSNSFNTGQVKVLYHVPYINDKKIKNYIKNKNIIIWTGPLPLHMILSNKGCIAAVTHGGSGTVHTVALYRVPNIIIPIISDQYYWSYILSIKKIGIFCDILKLFDNSKNDSDQLKIIIASKMIISLLYTFYNIKYDIIYTIISIKDNIYKSLIKIQEYLNNEISGEDIATKYIINYVSKLNL